MPVSSPSADSTQAVNPIILLVLREVIPVFKTMKVKMKMKIKPAIASGG
jgi:hypothetical protein